MNSNDNINNLEELVRELRKNLFLRTQFSYAPEREWEEEEQIRDRMKNNIAKRKEWDKITEDMIQDCKEKDIIIYCEDT